MAHSFCPLPFRHIAFTVKGDARLCCESAPLRNAETKKPLNIRNYSTLDIWNSVEYDEVRKQFLNGKRPKECETCWKQEEKGLLSMRDSHYTNLSESKKNELFIEAQSQTPKIESIEIRFDNTCNQMCRTCDPFSSSKWVQFFDKNSKHPVLRSMYGEKHQVFAYTAKESIERLSESIQYAKRIKFLGGEPSLQPQVKELLNKMIANNQAHSKEIHIVTNGTDTALSLLPLLNVFQKSTVMISIDAVNIANDYIRIGSSWENCLNVLAESLKLDDRHSLQVNTVVSAYNFLIFDKLIEQLAQPQYQRVEHYLTFLLDPAPLRIDTLPKHLQLIGRQRIEVVLHKIPKNKVIYQQLERYLDSPLVEATQHQNEFCDHIEILDQASIHKGETIIPEVWNWLQTL